MFHGEEPGVHAPFFFSLQPPLQRGLFCGLPLYGPPLGIRALGPIP